MSTNPKCRHSSNEIHFNSEKESCICAEGEKRKNKLSHLVDYVNNNNLNDFYPKEESIFKKRIDKLNLKFYIETEKYLANKNDMNKCQDQLFLILFKQISLYIDEIERLNSILKDRREDQKLRLKIEEIYTRQKEYVYSQQLINFLRTNNYQLEKKLVDRAHIEEKMKAENESLKRQNKFYKEKLKVDLAYRKLHTELNHETSVMNNGAEVFTIIRSGSKDSGQNKISFGPTNKESVNETKSNSNSNEIMISENPNTFTSNDSMRFSKILNKKRNYSDNNPNQIKKIHLEVNPIVNNPGNNRYINCSSVEHVNKLEKKVSKSNLFSGGGDCNGGKGNAVNGDLLATSFTNAKGIQIPNNIGQTSSSPPGLQMNKSMKSPKDKAGSHFIFTNSRKNMIDLKKATKANSFNIQKDLKIIKTVKQQLAGKMNGEEKSEKGLSQMISCSEGIDSINPAHSSRGNAEFNLQDSYFSSYMALDTELNELSEIESLLRSMRTQFCFSGIESSAEVEITKNSNGLNELSSFNGGGMASDEECEGYRSSNSCASENPKISHPDAMALPNSDVNIINRIGKSSNKCPILTSITIDLIGKTLVSTEEERKNTLANAAPIGKKKRCMMNTMVGSMNSYTYNLNSAQGKTKKI